MPGYAGSGMAQLLRQNQQVALFQQERILAGDASIAVQLERNRSIFPTGVSVQIYFTDINGNPANPGTFEVDVQTSDIDQDSQYCVANAVTKGLNANFVVRAELGEIFAKFVRVFVKTLGGSVYTTVELTSFTASGSGSGTGAGGGGGGGGGGGTAGPALLGGSAPAFFRFFGDGSDGAISGAASPAVWENWLTTYTLNAGQTLNASSVLVGIPLVIRATQQITIGGTMNFQPRPSGFQAIGGGSGGGGGGGTAAGAIGTAQGFFLGTGAAGGTAGAAGGGTGGNGLPLGTGPVRWLLSAMGSMAAPVGTQMPAYGGTFGGAGGSAGGAAGLGAGAVFFIAPIIDFQATAIINLAAGNGGAAPTTTSGGGGGGGGGLVVFSAQQYINQSGTVNVAGGLGGAAFVGGSASGAGGNGAPGSYKFLVIA